MMNIVDIAKLSIAYFVRKLGWNQFAKLVTEAKPTVESPHDEEQKNRESN